MADGFTPIFKPAGTGHRAGAVPDPGPGTAGSDVLHADATWGPEVASSYESGTSNLTVTAGNPSATGSADFLTPYGAPPLVFVASDNDQLIPSIVSIGDTHAVVQLTAATPVVDDTSGNISWLAIG